jgi:hypothetical protein
MKRPLAPRAAPDSFALDRERFGAATREGFGELEGIDGYCEGGVAMALTRRFGDAREAGAIIGPPGVEVIVYGIEDSLIVALREEELPIELPVAMRQLATISFETKHVLNSADQSFEEACAAIEELLARASALLPSFAALKRGERGLGSDGRRRRFWRLRRLASAARS